jgi:acyl carrier protein
MVPSSFTRLEKFPMTANGKVDRKALPKPERSELEQVDSFVLPRSEVEQMLASIWAEALHLDKIGIHENFFDIGGNSLLLVKVKAQIDQVMNRSIPTLELFNYPTIETLAVYLSEGASAGVSSIGSIVSNETKLKGKERIRKKLRRKKRSSGFGVN